MVSEYDTEDSPHPKRKKKKVSCGKKITLRNIIAFLAHLLYPHVIKTDHPLTYSEVSSLWITLKAHYHDF